MTALDEIIEKYTDPSVKVKNPTVASLTARITPECKLQLQYIAFNLGTKMSPLMSEIIQKSTKELFGRLDFSEGVMKEYFEDLAEL